MIRFVGRLLFLGFIIWGQSAFAQEVLLEGLSEEDQSQIEELFPDTSRHDLEQIDNIIRRIMQFQTYEQASAFRLNNGQVVIRAIPIRLIQKVSFKGNRQIRTSELLRVSELEEGQRFNRAQVLKAGEALKEFYGRSGYFNTIIEVNFVPIENKNHLHISFVIDEQEPCIIEEILFSTSNPNLKTRLENQVHRYKGRKFSDTLIEDVQSRINNYLRSNRYLTAEVASPQAMYNEEKTRVTLSLEIQNPYRYEFFFSGYEFFSLSDIYRHAQIDNHDRAINHPPAEIADRLRKTYLSHGFPNVRVQFEEQRLENNFLIRSHINIEEGYRVKIQEISVSGRISNSPHYYARFVKNNSSPLIARGYYNREDLDLGIRNLVTELRNQGYLRARVQSSRLEYLDTRSQAKISIVLDEGPLTQIRDIRFSGIEALDSHELINVLNLRPNTPLRLNDLESGIERLQQHYYNKGYLEMRLLNEDESLVEYNERGTHANLNFEIYEGPKIIAESIRIEGNSFTKDKVILNEIDFKEGDVLTPHNIEESTIRLNRLGIFSRANITTLEEGTNISERTAVITVVERDPGLVRFGVGLNSERRLTATGTTGLSYNNLFGTARALSGRVKLSSNIAEINYLEHEVTAGYLEPFMFNSRVRGRVNLTRSEIVREYIRSNEITKIVTSNRLDLLLENDWTRHTRLTWRLWSLDSRREFERNSFCSDSTPENRTFCSPDVQQVAKIGPIIDIDYRDNSFLPTMGSYTRLSADVSTPSLGSSESIQFFKTEALFTYYFRLGSTRTIWANSVRGGYLTKLGDRPGTGAPASEAFILGGVSTIRGFDGTTDGDRVPSKSADEFPIRSSTDILIQSDSHYYLYKSEFRVPIYGEHGAVFFYDGGLVHVSGYDFSKPYRHSVGLGYRYNTPVGPVSLDLGFKLEPREDEAPWRIHFSIGTF